MEGAITIGTGRQEWTVGPAAQLAGTTVRALHHYDAIGLVTPSGRSPAGYRTYSAADVDRLRRVLLYRELGFPLERVAELLAEHDSGCADGTAALLREQLSLLREQGEQVQRRIMAVEQELEALEMGQELTQEQKRELFGDSWVENEAEYAREAEQRWGDTDAWRESQRRVSRMTADDWRAVRDDAEDVERGLADLLAAGEPATGPAAMDLAERHRAHVDRWFYPVSYELQRSLGDMYLADERFTAYYDRRAPGLARYLRDAIHANADRRDQQDPQGPQDPQGQQDR